MGLEIELMELLKETGKNNVMVVMVVMEKVW
jgi:hypothetical protein